MTQWWLQRRALTGAPWRAAGDDWGSSTAAAAGADEALQLVAEHGAADACAAPSAEPGFGHATG